MIVSRASAQEFLGKKLKGLGGGRRSYYVLSEDGSRSFGGPYTKAAAEKRLGQVEYFKHNPSSLKKDVRKLLKDAESKGCVVRMGKRHYKVRCPEGAQITVSSSPSDHRVLHKIRKDFRKVGIMLNPGEPDTMPRKPMSKKPTSARKEKPYTVYLVQEKPRGLVLYSFCSRDLISPSASASEYAWLLGESAIEESGTHIFTSDVKLKKFLAKRPGRISRGRPRYPNPRNSKVKDALAAEATRFKDFNEFSSAYWNSCSRGLYWVATNEKRFHIGLEERKRIKNGTFFVACSPALALSGKNEGKKFVAELDVTRLPNGSINVKRGSGGSEIKIVDSAGAIKVTRVLEGVKAKRSFKWQLSILPSSKDELRTIWDNAWDKRRKDAEKKRVRKEKMLERELKRAEARTKEEAQAVDRAAKKVSRKTAEAKRERERKSRKAKATKKRVKRVAATRKATAATKASVRTSTSKKKSSKKKASKKPTAKKPTAKKKASKKKASKKKASKKAPKGTKWVRMKNPSKGTRRVRSHINNPGK